MFLMCKSDITLHRRHIADSKVHGANMGPIWGWQGPVGPHVGPMNFAIWESVEWLTLYHCGWIKLCFRCINLIFHSSEDISLIARFLGPTWGPSGADRTQVGPMNIWDVWWQWSKWDLIPFSPFFKTYTCYQFWLTHITKIYSCIVT